MNKIQHANIIVGQSDSQNFVFNILDKDLGFKPQANPDFLSVEVESFGIGDARNLGRWAIGKPLSGDKKVCLIKTKSITPEAQNALLKTLEEPTAGTYFFIILESLGGILGTFLSRTTVLNAGLVDIDLNNNKDTDARNFLKGSIKERLTLVGSLSKKEDKGLMKDLIKNLEEMAYKEKRQNQAVNLKNILTSKIFLTSRGSSPRMLLEWLSCVI